MYKIIFLLILALIWIIFASVQDLRKREVADWLNYSLIIFALGFRFFYCLFDASDFSFFYQGLIGLGIFFVIGNLFYYSHFFAGGDAKLMIALGAILPLSESFVINLNIFMAFFIVFLFVGAIYGLIFSFILAGKNWNKFKKEFWKRFRATKKQGYFIMILGIVIMIFGFGNLWFVLGIFVFFSYYVLIFAKVVEEVCMVKKMSSKNLVEGDWLYKDIKIKNKVIKSKWDGLNKEEIRLIKMIKKNVLIKQGIPFVPVFLISFLVVVWLLWNPLWNFNIF